MRCVGTGFVVKRIPEELEAEPESRQPFQRPSNNALHYHLEEQLLFRLVLPQHTHKLHQYFSEVVAHRQIVWILPHKLTDIGYHLHLVLMMLLIELILELFVSSC